MNPTLAPTSPLSPHTTLFSDFFRLGQEETASPFLTPDARRWSAHLTLKASLAAAFLLAAAFVLSFLPAWVPLAHLFLLLVYFLAGVPSLIESIEDLAEFDINIDVLMTLAAFSSILIGSGFEGGLLLVLFALSGSIEDLVLTRAQSSLNQLHQLAPTMATVVDEKGYTLQRAVQDIALGTPILIRAGEIVPLDGIVVEGTSSLNLVHLTGENLPVMKTIGDEVPAGSRNLDGALTLKVTHTSSDSTLSRIINLVTQAQESRPRLQRWFDRLSRAYALTIISLSAFFALIFPLVLSIPFLGRDGSLYRALAFLIAASPCALILALPIAYLSAISACARKGILLKGGMVLDALAQCSAIAFDKTGTLTTGELTVSGIFPLNNALEPKVALAIAYALERQAVHPIANAIQSYAKDQAIAPLPIKDFRLIPGFGVEGVVTINGKECKAFMGNPGMWSDAPMKEITSLKDQGLLVALLKIEEQSILFAFQDTIRPGLKEALDRLKQIGMWKLLMLTGDHKQNAAKIAQELSIPDYYADLKPEDKLDHVTRLAQAQGLAMIGDGINDAPALARATVGICMGKVGSGTAIEAADVVLLHDDLAGLDWLMLKAKQTTAIVRENLTIALVAIVIASFPALAGWVPLWLAVILHEGGTLLVGLNALRLQTS